MLASLCAPEIQYYLDEHTDDLAGVFDLPVLQLGVAHEQVCEQLVKVIETPKKQIPTALYKDCKSWCDEAQVYLNDVDFVALKKEYVKWLIHSQRVASPHLESEPSQFRLTALNARALDLYRELQLHYGKELDGLEPPFMQLWHLIQACKEELEHCLSLAVSTVTCQTKASKRTSFQESRNASLLSVILPYSTTYLTLVTFTLIFASVQHKWRYNSVTSIVYVLCPGIAQLLHRVLPPRLHHIIRVGYRAIGSAQYFLVSLMYVFRNEPPTPLASVLGWVISADVFGMPLTPELSSLIAPTALAVVWYVIFSSECDQTQYSMLKFASRVIFSWLIPAACYWTLSRIWGQFSTDKERVGSDERHRGGGVQHSDIIKPKAKKLAGFGTL